MTANLYVMCFIDPLLPLFLDNPPTHPPTCLVLSSHPTPPARNIPGSMPPIGSLRFAVFVRLAI